MKIDWYPGHMNKAKINIKKNLALVDLIIELLDARAPLSTSSPEMRKFFKGKKFLILIGKSDLADQKVTKEWQKYFLEQGIRALPVDARKKEDIKRVIKTIMELFKDKRNKDLAKGVRGQRLIKVMLCGMPNVGKSTLVNTMLGRAKALTGDKAGVTKGIQWLNVKDEFLLLDTPGVIWPKLNDEHMINCLSLIGSLNDDALNKEDLVLVLVDFLYQNYKDFLYKRYDISQDELEAKLKKDEEENISYGSSSLSLLNLLALKRGCLKTGGTYDYLRAGTILIDDFRNFKIGPVSLESPVTVRDRV